MALRDPSFSLLEGTHTYPSCVGQTWFRSSYLLLILLFACEGSSAFSIKGAKVSFFHLDELVSLQVHGVKESFVAPIYASLYIDPRLVYLVPSGSLGLLYKYSL